MSDSTNKKLSTEYLEIFNDYSDISRLECKIGEVSSSFNSIVSTCTKFTESFKSLENKFGLIEEQLDELSDRILNLENKITTIDRKMDEYQKTKLNYNLRQFGIGHSIPPIRFVPEHYNENNNKTKYEIVD